VYLRQIAKMNSQAETSTYTS